MNEILIKGEDVYLSIDIRLQSAFREELINTIDRFAADSGSIVAIDITTGEIIALSSFPDFNPNKGIQPKKDANAIFNRASLGRYEMGSTFKAFTLAMALDSGVVTLRDEFDASEPLRIGRTVIRDFHPKSRWLSVPEIFAYSSNIGAARIALLVGGERQKAFLKTAGLLDELNFELPEISRPGYPRKWREINTATIS